MLSFLGGLGKLKGSEFLLDGYVTLHDPEDITVDSSNYSFQCFQGNHRDEYTLKKDHKVCLFQNGILKMYYEVDNEGCQIGEFTRFENGCVAFVQSFDDIWEKRNFVRIINHVRGERMEIYSYQSDHMIYHGEFNEKREREGWGIQYDEESGEMLLEGIWKENKLVEIIRKIEGSIMIEFKRNGDNTIASNRIPRYIGEFVYDEEKESFIRNGRGYWIDENTRIATRECEWKDGKEVSGRNLYDGWYTRSTKRPVDPLPIINPSSIFTSPITGTEVTNSTDLTNLSLQVTDLLIASDCCNDIGELDLSKFQNLRSIIIGSDSFCSVKTFRIDGLNRLKSLKIGKNSFTELQAANWDWKKAVNQSKSFHIVNCSELESIEIGEYSFSDFGGQFEVANLPSLLMITIGEYGKISLNFYSSSFVIRGIWKFLMMSVQICRISVPSLLVMGRFIIPFPQLSTVLDGRNGLT